MHSPLTSSQSDEHTAPPQSVRQGRTLVESLASGDPLPELLARRLAHLSLGIISSLGRREISFADAARQLFNSDNLRDIKRRGLCPDLVSLFEMGLSLEDVSRLRPSDLAETYHRMIGFAASVIRMASSKSDGLDGEEAAA